MVLQKYFLKLSNGPVLRKSVFMYFLCRKEYGSWRCAKKDQQHMEHDYEENTQKVWKQLLQTYEHVS